MGCDLRVYIVPLLLFILLTDGKITVSLSSVVRNNTALFYQDSSHSSRRKLLSICVYLLLLERDKVAKHINGTVSSVDYYILHRAITYNVKKAATQVINTYEKKIKNLTRNTVLPFTPSETVTNLSSYNLTSEQLDTLKLGLAHSICPPSINKTDVLN